MAVPRRNIGREILESLEEIRGITMAKPKGWTKRNREFLNVAGSGCMAGVSWNASLSYMKKWDKKGEELIKDEYIACAEGEIEINREGQTHFINRKADLRPIRTMKRELLKFEEACEAALKEAEEYNAKS